jgi:thymidylate synthase
LPVIARERLAAACWLKRKYFPICLNEDSLKMTEKQKIIVFEQNGKAKTKIQGIAEYGGGLFDVEVISMATDFPAVIDDAKKYFPSQIEADLVLDYLVHPDLSHDLGIVCLEKNIPVVASGKKNQTKGVFTPPTCCGLARNPLLGLYGETFGAPEVEVSISNGKIVQIIILRGAPCGATWKACENIIGTEFKEALTRIGLETQFLCSANPAGWDPIYGKSPVHFAGHVHNAALKKALTLLSFCGSDPMPLTKEKAP